MSASKFLKVGLDTLSAIVIIATGVLLSWRLLQSRDERPVRLIEAVKDVRVQLTDESKVLGRGQVAIIEFSDFECPVCRRFALNTLPEIKRRLIDTGQVRYVPFHFPLDTIHPRAVKAGEAAECAGRQGKYWAMHERLFADPPAVSLIDFGEHAEAIQLDASSFAQCLSGQAVGKVRADQAEGRRLRVDGTPSFFLGLVRNDGAIDLITRINGAATADTFAKEIENVRASVSALSGR